MWAGMYATLEFIKTTIYTAAVMRSKIQQLVLKSLFFGFCKESIYDRLVTEKH